MSTGELKITIEHRPALGRTETLLIEIQPVPDGFTIAHAVRRLLGQAMEKFYEPKPARAHAGAE